MNNRLSDKDPNKNFKQMTGMPDPRSGMGIAARGKNVYSGGLPAANNKNGISLPPSKQLSPSVGDNPVQAAAKRKLLQLHFGVQ